MVRRLHAGGRNGKPIAAPSNSGPGDAADETAVSTEPPSRSARKREALARQALGVRLTRLTATQLLTLGLPEELLEAVLEAQRLRGHIAVARQRQYIGRLMRQIDPEPIERALDVKLKR